MDCHCKWISAFLTAHRGTASPVRLLQGALVIWVLNHTSQFRSFGKWVWILCYLDFDFTYVGHSESESWEMCVGTCTSVSLRLSVNFSNRSGRSRKRSNLDCRPSFEMFVLVFWGWSAPVSWCKFVTWAGVVDNFYNADVDDELLPELVENPGTTRGTKLSWLHTKVFPWSTVVFDSWPTHRSIHGLRRVFQAIEQQALLPVIALSRRDQDRDRFLVPLRLCALPRWQWVPQKGFCISISVCHLQFTYCLNQARYRNRCTSTFVHG